MPAIAYSDTAVNLALRFSHLLTGNHASACPDNHCFMSKMVIYCQWDESLNSAYTFYRDLKI